MTFSYYGAKTKIASLYPEPEHDCIIEPFAGAAAYSLAHLDKTIFLNDLDDDIYETWRWLKEEATEKELLYFSKLEVGQDLRDLPIGRGHRNYLGYNASRGSAAPRNIITKWSAQRKEFPALASTIEYRVKETIKILPKIQHFFLANKDYKDLPNLNATWFIDPPYQEQGKHYTESDINYEELADFCATRRGQVIVCEQKGASWLPFKPLVDIQGSRKKSTEVYWTNS